ncbi:hypothetical protein Tco_1293264 [Tanacetum coccineum]
MELLRIKGKSLKDQENPLGIITKYIKLGIVSPYTEGLTTDCSPTCPKAQERSSLQKRQLEASNSLLICLEVDSPETRLNRRGSEIRAVGSLGKRRKEEREGVRHSVGKRPVEGNNGEVGEIMFPPLRNISSADLVIIKAYTSGRQVNRVYLDGGSSCEVIYEHCFLKLKPSIQSLQCPPFTELYNSIRPKESSPSFPSTTQDTEERIVVNDYYPKQTIAKGRQLATKTKIRLQDLLRVYVDVFTWTTAHMTGVLRTIIIGGEAFNIEHRVNELKHLEPVKQKKRSLAPERNEAIHTQVEELTKANIL